MTGTGYRELARHVAGEITLEEAVDLMERSTRRYARRQRTWFRNQLPGTGSGVIRVDATLPLGAQVDGVVTAWRTMTTTSEESE